MKPLIYLASPYSAKQETVVERRVVQTQDAAARLLKAGHIVISPILHSHPMAGLVSFDHAQWLDVDKQLIDRSDEVWVLCLDGYAKSEGVKIEVDHAQATGKAVRFIDYPELIDVTDENKNFGKQTHTSYPCDRHIIGLTGFAQAGKDTFAESLVHNHGYVRVALADAVRNALYALNPTVRSSFDGRILVELQTLVDIVGWSRAKTEHENVRELLQRFGTEAGRDIHGEDCWINIAKAKIEALAPQNVVVTDVRFPNEAEFIHSLQGEIIEIVRPDFERLNDHDSEQSLPAEVINWRVSNNGTIEDLWDAASHIAFSYEDEV